MTAPRDTLYVQRLVAFGVVFVVIFLVFILYNGFKNMASTDYLYSEEAYKQS